MPVPPKPKPPAPKKANPSKAKPSTTKARKSPGYSTALTKEQAQWAWSYGPKPSRAGANAAGKAQAAKVKSYFDARERKARQRGMATTATQPVESSWTTEYPASTDRGARKAPKRMSYQTRKSGGRKS